MTKKVDPLAQQKPKVDVMQEKATPGGEGGGTNGEVPGEIVPLPSKGKLYETDHPLYGEDSVQIKRMSNKEENILHSRALIRKGLVVNELIKSCLLNKSIDPDGLLIGDKSAILTAVRITGLGKDYLTKTTSPCCEEVFDHTFDLSKCQIKELAEDPIKTGENLFEFTLPQSGAKVKFKLLTAGDESDISATQEARRKAIKKQAPNASEVDTNITDRLMKSIVSYDGERDKFKIAKHVMEMRSPDSRAIRSYIRRIEPDLNMVEEVECPQCGDVEKHNIPMGIEFLWPEL